jgi:hypothetical protein
MRFREFSAFGKEQFLELGTEGASEALKGCRKAFLKLG